MSVPQDRRKRECPPCFQLRWRGMRERTHPAVLGQRYTCQTCGLVGFAVGVVFALRGIFRSLTEDWKARS